MAILLREAAFFSISILATLLPLSFSRGQPPKDDRYKDWTDARIAEERDSLRKKSRARYADENVSDGTARELLKSMG